MEFYFSPLPFPSANRIVAMFQDKPNFPKGAISYPNFLDWQRDNRSFEAIAAYRWGDGSITGVGQAEDVHAQRVSWNFFPILSVKPILGRNFNPEEDRRGANPTVMISEGLWKRKFGSDRNVIGQRLIVAGEGRTIIGVVPSSFRLTIQNFKPADIYRAHGRRDESGIPQKRFILGNRVIGLLKPGVTLQQAREDMELVNGELAPYPDINANIKSTITTLKDEIVGDVRPVLLVLLGAVVFVLLIACVNVANLLLARSVRGGVSSRSVPHLAQAGFVFFVSSLSKAYCSAVRWCLGLVVAKWGTMASIAAIPASTFAPTIPRAEDIRLDPRVLLFTLIVSVITGVAFGLLPALKSFRRNISETLKDTARTTSGPRSRVQAAFVVGEMAMALVLLIGAGLMLRTLMQLWTVDPGFDPHNVINFGITPPTSLPDKFLEAIRAVLRQLHSTVQDVPGVEDVSLQWGANPMQGDTETTFMTEGQQPTARQADLPFALDYVVEPEYLKAMRIPLLRGRFVDQSDNEYSARVAVIDSSFAREYFAGQDPIGKHVSIFDFDQDTTQRTWMPLTVVGGSAM